MGRLTSGDLRAALEAAGRLADVSEVRDEAGFHTHTVGALAEVLPGTWTASERYRFSAPAPASSGRDGTRSDTSGAVEQQAGTVVGEIPPALYEAFLPHVREHAFFADMERHCVRKGRGSGADVSGWVVTMDAFTRRGRRFKRMGLYADFYRHLDITDQLSLGVALSAEEAVVVTLSRDRGYTAAEAARLALLGPHLGAAWRTFEAMRAARERGGEAERETLDVDGLMLAFRLPRRRAEVLSLICKGASNRAIAERLGLRVGTVRKHVELLLHDLGVSNRNEATALVRRYFRDGGV